MTPLFILFIILLIVAASVFGPDLRDARRARIKEKQRQKQAIIDAKLEAERVAKLFVEYPEMTNGRPTYVDGQSMALYTRLKRLWDESDDETVKHAAKLIAEKHLFPAVRLATKNSSRIGQHLDLIEPNVKQLEVGINNKLMVALEVMTNYLTQVSEGVRALPSSLDLSTLAIEAAPAVNVDVTVSFMDKIKMKRN